MSGELEEGRLVRQVDAERIGELGLDPGRLAGAARPEQETAALLQPHRSGNHLAVFTIFSAKAMPFPEPSPSAGATRSRPTPPWKPLLLELVPWVMQWHNEPDPTYDGQRVGGVYEAFVPRKRAISC